MRPYLYMRYICANKNFALWMFDVFVRREESLSEDAQCLRRGILLLNPVFSMCGIIGLVPINKEALV